jgi:phosphoglycolate phosphatase
MTLRLAIFDCDGTLVDSQADIAEAMEAAFAAHALPAPPRAAIRRIVGLSLGEAIHRLVPHLDPETATSLVAGYKDAFRANRAAGGVAEPLYEGIAALIADLDASGWLLAVATGKSDRGLAHCLERHGLTGHFATLQTADRHPSKPDPSMIEACLAATGASLAQTVMIGDTAYDMAMAVNAGCRAIGVDWGYHHPDELIDAGAQAVVGSVAELRALLRGLEA